ncbi:hypothetical protein BDA99DRAFT_177671 [Phascolomyces articulosus]|uniref:Cation-transporting P-type ATPase N-terminal domain-containing protein n=1 Tax=Phascolomyces articulosus TaxID=60185 RepID=A0AAD5PBT2_9FUNG|nr:hypothetical protein BDA99DRAFT_177671 [Phascolomyces articulosus]
MNEKTETVEVVAEEPVKVNHSAGNVKTLTVEELYDKDKYDLSTMEPDDVLQLLQTQPNGLTSDEAAQRIEKFGYNKLQEKETNAFLQFLGFMWNPLSWVMEAAAIVSIALANGDGKPPDYPDFIGIVLLLLANSLIGFYEERQAGNAVKALMESLAPECKVKRDGEWKTMEAAELVPGDVISIKLGDVIPADGRLLSVSFFFATVFLPPKKRRDQSISPYLLFFFFFLKEEKKIICFTLLHSNFFRRFN